MKELTTKIRISTTPEKAWQTITNLNTWPHWNPIVNKLDGNFELGASLDFVMSTSKGEDGKKYSAKITDINNNKSFSYVAKMMSKAVFSAERILEVEKTSDGVLFKQKEVYTGFLAPLFWKKLKEDALPMIESMNQGLKKELENN